MNQEHMPAQGPVDVNVRERIGYCPVCETHRPSLPAPAEGTCAFCHNHLMKPCRECLNHDATGNGEQRCKGSPAGVLMAKCAELEAELSTWIQAVGLASTIKPDMVIDVSDPIGMMQKVVGHVEQLQAELETERMRLAACGVVALANTPKSAAKARDMLPEYFSGSCEDVAKAVDREMALRDRVEQLEAKLDQEQRKAGQEMAERLILIEKVQQLEAEIEHLRREVHAWSKACEDATTKLYKLSTHHPRLEVRYWTGKYWEPLYGARFHEVLNALDLTPNAGGNATERSEGRVDHNVGRRLERSDV